MELLKDSEYFRDIDENGQLVAGKKGKNWLVSNGARYCFLESVLEEKTRSFSFEVEYRKIEAKKFLIKQRIESREEEAWYRCVNNFIRNNPEWIVEFPDTEYYLHELKDNNDDCYHVKLDCRDKIRNHQSDRLKRLKKEMDEVEKQRADNRDLRVAAVLAMIHFLLNAATTLSVFPGYEWLYFGHWSPMKWGLIVAGMMLVAGVCHMSKMKIPHVTVMLALSTFVLQITGPDLVKYNSGFLRALVGVVGVDGKDKFFLWGCIVTLASLIYGIRYTVGACGLADVRGRLAAWVKEFDAQVIYAHKELRFLALWYKHMTGNTCDNIETQEKTLRECLNYANKHR